MLRKLPLSLKSRWLVVRYRMRTRGKPNSSVSAPAPRASSGMASSVRQRLSRSQQRLRLYGQKALSVVGEPGGLFRARGLPDRRGGAVEGVDNPEVCRAANRSQLESESVLEHPAHFQSFRGIEAPVGERDSQCVEQAVRCL